jgi:hypothetical protein
MHKKLIIQLILSSFLFVVIYLIAILKFIPVNASTSSTFQEDIRRFGITIPYKIGNYVNLVNQINAKAILDWSSDDTNEWSGDVEYIHVIRVSDTTYNNGALLSTIENLIEDNIGEVWIIGNEPDRFCVQDSINPEVYAQRYFEIATRIRHYDPTAQIGFGSIVQPTPIRIRYLERAIDHLTMLSCGNRQAALDLIDIWSIHAFLLNEEPNKWGADIPVGFFTYEFDKLPDNLKYCFTGEKYTNDYSDAEIFIDFTDTHSIELFSERVINFRNWMNSIGEREKPLWITEYGSLLPPIDPVGGPNYVNVSDEITAQFMVDTFNFMMTSIGESNGYITDNNRLVQRWFWYSLDEYRYVFGGSLFDPDFDLNQTKVGEAFKAYTNQILLTPPSGKNPVLFRQSGPEFPVFYDESSEIFNYPYEICFLCQLPLVLK